MEIVRKEINLEQFKSRFNGKSPVVDESVDYGDSNFSNWGMIPKDFVVSPGSELWDLKDTLPFSVRIDKTGDGYSIGERNVLTYRTAIHWYSWLEKFFSTTKIYQICRRNGEIKLFAKFKADDETFIEFLSGKTDAAIFTEINVFPDDFNDEDIGKYIWANNDYQTFLDVFSPVLKTIEDAYSHAVDFINEVGEKMKDSSIETSIPNASVNLLITDSIDNLGTFTSVLDWWIPNKRYYINDIVLHEDEGGEIHTYKLIKGDDIETIPVPNQIADEIRGYIGNDYDGVTYEDATSMTDEQIKSEQRPNKVFVYQEENDRMYLKVLYYKGYFHNGQTEFDSSEGEHWLLVENCGMDFGDDIDIPSDSGSPAYAESRLYTLKRGKVSYDDDNNKLPFIVEFDASGETIIPYGEFVYVPNIPFNLTVGEDGSIRCSYIESITFNGQEFTNNAIIKSSDISDDYGECVFVYYVGVIQVSNGVFDNEFAVKYTETFSYEKKICTATVDKSTMDFEYIELTPIVPDDIPEDFDEHKRYARIEIENPALTADSFLCSPYIMEDAMVGVENTKKTYDKFVIERGTAAAFERHHVLGEVCTFDDLEKYKNGFFTLKTEENGY